MVEGLKLLSVADLTAIHNITMDILANVGIAFHSNEATNIFRQHGYQTDGRLVFMEEDLVMDAIANAPSSFSIRGRNPSRDVTIGVDGLVFAPGYGAPFIVDLDQGKRWATLADYRDLVRLAQDLPNQDLSGHLLVQPTDVAASEAHLRMLQAGMIHSDKPYLGSTENATAAEHTMEMSAILFDEPLSSIKERPVTIGLVDSLSPLSYSEEMAGALISYARWGQPLILAALVMAGATGPITLAGLLAQQNAELLAGIVLAELTNPGTPVVYASASTNMDLRTGSLAIGSPELSLATVASIQLAHFYGLPARGGGALTDSNSPDSQAGSESMFTLLTAANSGADFILHAAGILSSFLAFSYEKFVLDDEMCGMVRHFHRGIKVEPETLAYDVIARVGPGGNFLRQRHTQDRCRSAFWQPIIADRTGLEQWETDLRQDARQRARQRWTALLAEHEDPQLDSTIAHQLDVYVEEHC